MTVAVPTKVCPKCDQLKPTSAFHRNSAKKDGLSTYCRDCKRTFSKTPVEADRVRFPDWPECRCGCGEPASVALYTDPAREQVKGGPTRYKQGHHSTGPDYIEDPETGCWVWQKALVNGYGQKTLPSGTRYAHRVYYQRHHGIELDPKLEVHHKCRNRACVNPDHLEALTREEHVLAHEPDRKRWVQLPEGSYEELVGVAVKAGAEAVLKYGVGPKTTDAYVLSRIAREILSALHIEEEKEEGRDG